MRINAQQPTAAGAARRRGRALASPWRSCRRHSLKETADLCSIFDASFISSKRGSHDSALDDDDGGGGSDGWIDRSTSGGRSERVDRIQTAPAKPAAVSAKTPWGDPDLQGTWTTDSAYGIPLQRPAQFAGRAELNDEEYKQKVDRDTQTRTRAENAVGSFRGDGAWLTKSFRQTSLIVEPADGTLPPLTPEAEKKRPPRLAEPTGTVHSMDPKISRCTTAASRSESSDR